MTTLRERQLSECFEMCMPKVKCSMYKYSYLFVFWLIPDALKQMLNLNQPLTKNMANEPTWKVLIYDRVGQDIISPLVSVKALREMGVTLHV